MSVLGVWPDDFSMRKVGVATNLGYTVVSISGPSGTDSTLTPACFSAINATDYWEGLFWTAATDFWFTIRFGSNATSQASSAAVNDRTVFELRGATGPVMRIRRDVSVIGDGTANVNKLTAEYWTGSAWTALSGFHLAGGVQGTRVTFRVKIDASAGEFSWYADGVIKGTFTGDTTVTGQTSVTEVRLRGPAPGTTWWFFEIAAATDDLRFARVATFVPNAAPTVGDGTAWTGDFTAIDETNLNEADVISTTNANDVEAWNASDKAVVLAGHTVLSAGMMTWTRAGATGPQNIHHAVYVGSTLYESSNLSGISTAYAALRNEWTTNPATGTAWTLSALDGVRWAVKSIT